MPRAAWERALRVGFRLLVLADAGGRNDARVMQFGGAHFVLTRGLLVAVCGPKKRPIACVARDRPLTLPGQGHCSNHSWAAMV